MINELINHFTDQFRNSLYTAILEPNVKGTSGLLQAGLPKLKTFGECINSVAYFLSVFRVDG